MPEVKVTWNSAEFSRKAELFEKALYSEIKNAALAVRTLFRKDARELFGSQGSSGKHGRWAALSPNYKRWKDRHYPGQGIMVLSGKLQDSLTRDTDGSIFRVVKSGNRYIVSIGTDVNADGFDYPSYHQERAKKRRRTIDPKEETWNRWAQILQNGVIIKGKQTLFDVATATKAAQVRNV